ncbi:MAG: precorrin-6y C5,15-methyltransferase (decarboxylating) subunit CbiE [Deltaproteobacteria bacterium]|jgi:precorrin-6Y C5,15-methyltransferase (decarboxylating)|nr:precorrin-6y C5,15-methyltransferase (decarboxylating) subunit CbiE [Deltaproteobacteria bacterium]
MTSPTAGQKKKDTALATPPIVQLVGLSSPTDISLDSQKILAEATVLAGPERLLGFFPDFAHCKIPLAGSLMDWLRAIELKSRTQSVVVLASGDPNFFGLAEKLLSVIDPERVQIWPGTTMVQKAFALARRPWAGVETVSLHGRPSWRAFWAATFRLNQRGGSLAVYTDPKNTPALIAQALLARGQAHLRLTLFEDLATPSQKMTSLSLEEAQSRNFSPLNLVTLEAPKTASPIFLGAPEELYGPENGLITKSETRLLALGLLRLRGGETFWDLGAGCGSVTVEAGRLLERGELWALEKNPARFQRILNNQRQFGLAHLSVVLGEAPAQLAELPDPDRVFVGGGGQALGDILREVLRRLKPGGIVVAATIDPGHLALATEILGQGRTPDVTQLAAARSQALGPGYYLKPLSQIWLTRGFSPK